MKEEKHKEKKFLLIHGGDKRIRTDDLLIAKQMLYQLSYIPTGTLERVKGLEPSTTTLARLYSTTELHPRRQQAIYIRKLKYLQATVLVISEIFTKFYIYLLLQT
jgi:hypothetical protein